MKTLWFDTAEGCVRYIDQTLLPHTLSILTLQSADDAANAIVHMKVRGAPLIGITAAYGVWLAMQQQPDSLAQVCHSLLQTRPTAVNLRWALTRMEQALQDLPLNQREAAALQLANHLLAEDAAACSAIGDHGLAIIKDLLAAKQKDHGPDVILNILTHCNAGWLATGAWGTALAPVYKAHLAGLPVHVWVDETRPRNQGASLTAWELGRSGVPHTLIVDNAGGHLMQHGMVDLCLVGSDRTTAQGDVCNKIGTYLKALAAFDNRVPFYAALPCSTIDFNSMDGLTEIPIEERDGDEVRLVQGAAEGGDISRVAVTPSATRVSNFGFDVTPARLVTGLITELGTFDASREGLGRIEKALRS
nr:S-methyl-5-thioribose-1-phosphate isomerase [Pseudohongiella spirulinae]